MKEKAFRIGRRTSELVLQYKSLAVMSVYAVVYLIAFYYLEQRDVAVHEIGMEIDGYIPFCEISFRTCCGLRMWRSRSCFCVSGTRRRATGW